ncbi:hypothetical protein FACHB389_29495 [Nostoc calcicola FACHB-389]|nr:hypothetical protein FACHB389_29495 [Nostoc calcicola FACHB-389]
MKVVKVIPIHRSSVRRAEYRTGKTQELDPETGVADCSMNFVSRKGAKARQRGLGGFHASCFKSAEPPNPLAPHERLPRKESKF